MKSVFPLLVASALLAGCQTVAPVLPAPTLGSSVSRLTVTIDPKDDIHEGAATYPLGFGSGLDFVGVQNGEWVFWGITDRGPNLDGPSVGPLTSKIFPAASFHPSLAEVHVKDGVARVTRVVPITAAGKAITGLPLPAGAVGFSQEVALSPDLQDLGNDVNGLDTETVRVDPKNPGRVWISDEYGPFILSVDTKTGAIIQKFGPGTGLPTLLAKRQANRGMEGLAVTPSGRVVGAMQSILDLDGKVKTSKAPFTRLVTLDPAGGKTAQFAYPIDAVYKKAADAKIGDLVALSETEFLILEQGNDKSGAARNLVYKISLLGATDLTGKTTAQGQEWEAAASLDELKAGGIVPVSKTLVMDLRQSWSWTSDKAEGLAVIDRRRFAVISDNDFGLATMVENPAAADGKPVTDPTAYALENGVLTLDKKPTEAKLKAGSNGQPTAFWVFTTLDPLF
jgi:hypothetical protein